jgi:acyl-CoA thioester hydrolase
VDIESTAGCSDGPSLAQRVYCKDTDLADIVYCANHLKFIEPGRMESVRPTTFGDELIDTTRMVAGTGARLVLDQVILHAGEQLFTAQGTVPCLTDAGQPVRFPASGKPGAGQTSARPATAMS